MSIYHRYCSGCGHGFYANQWNEATFCSRCGDELRDPPVQQAPVPQVIEEVYTPQRIPPEPTSEKHTWQENVQAGCQFAKDNPGLSAVAATGAGTAGLLLGPVIIATGKLGMIAGGVTIAAGLLLDSDSGALESPIVKVGAKLLGGSAAMTGGGYLATAAGGISLVAGIGVGASTGIKKIVQHRRRAKELATNINNHHEAGTCLEPT